MRCRGLVWLLIATAFATVSPAAEPRPPQNGRAEGGEEVPDSRGQYEVLTPRQKSLFDDLYRRRPRHWFEAITHPIASSTLTVDAVSLGSAIDPIDDAPLLSSEPTGQGGDQDRQSSDANDLANKLANPNAALGFLAFPIDYISYGGELPGASSQSAVKLSFQPSLPYPIGDGANFFVRPLIPVVFKQPVFNGGGFTDKGVDLGDISFDAALGKTWTSQWVTIGGIFGSAPTATDSALGLDGWTLGPEVLVGRATSWGFWGVLASQSWSISGDADSNVTAGQYFYTINLKNAWQIQAQPTYAYNHKAGDGNKLALPLGVGISKVIVTGALPIKFNFQYWYYVARPDTFGPRHQLRFQIIPIIPLPW